MQRGIGDRKAVRLSVRLYVKRVNCDKTNESSAQILMPYERSMQWHEEWLVGTTPSTWNFGPNWPTLQKTPTSNRYSLVAPHS